MTKKINNILKNSILLGLSTISSSAFASLCTSGVASTITSSGSPYAASCPQDKAIATLSGDAADYLDSFGSEIEAAGDEVAEQIAANSASEIKVITSGNEQLIKTLVNITNTQIKDQLTQDKLLLDMKMNYMTELNERELKATQGVVSMDDTKEEVLFILNELEAVGNQADDGTYNHAHEVIAAMKAKYDDDPSFLMPVRIKAASSSDSICEEYDPEKHKAGELDGSCFYSIKANPGAKLETYFQECSRIKRETLSNIQTNVSRNASSTRQQSSQSSYVSKSQTQSSQTLTAEKMAEQIKTSCSVKEFGYGLCENEGDNDEEAATNYLTKVIDNEIVPLGNISSSNYFAPVVVGSIDGDLGDEIDEEEFEAMRLKSLDAAENVSVSSNTPPIVYTYRTGSQYYAAEDFINNILNREAVSNINVTRAKSADTAEFQSKFMSRAASLSLAEYSLRKPIEARTGKTLSIALQDGSLSRDGVTEDDGTVSPFKEDINGAGELDRITFSVNKDYDRLFADATNAAEGNLSGINTAAPYSLSEWQIEALVQNNKLLLMENEKNERIELLLAGILANITNSESNINYINSFKYK